MNLAAINKLRDLDNHSLAAVARNHGISSVPNFTTRDALRLAIIDKIVERELKDQKEGNT